MSDGRCQVHVVPDIGKPDQPEKDKENFTVLSVVPETSIPVRPSKKKIVNHEPCVMPMELLEKLKDSKNLLVLDKSTEIDDEILQGYEELIFTNDPADITIDTPQSIKQINLSKKKRTIPKYISKAMSKLERSLSDISSSNVENDEYDYDSSQDNEKEKDVKGEKAIKKKQKKIRDILRKNKKNTDELDSVSVETKNELNKYLEYGIKTKKIKDIIKIIKQNKNQEDLENNNKPNININIFKIMKATADNDDDDIDSKKISKIGNNKVKATENVNSYSIQKEIEHDNNKYNSEKAISDETVHDKKSNNNTESVERNTKLNSDKYKSDHTNIKIHNSNETKIDDSKNKIKPLEKAKKTEIKLLKTNVHSESDSIENKDKKSEKKQKKKIKYHESDSTEKISAEKSDDTLKLLDENYKQLSESNDISINETMNNVNEIKPTDKNDDMPKHKTTLKPKRKRKKDLMYLQGPNALGGNYISYEVKYNQRRRNQPSSTAKTKFEKENRRTNSDSKNYYSVPFHILTKKRKKINDTNF